MRTEDEIAEREAAARVVETTRVRKQQRAAVEGNMYLCTHTPDARGSRESVVSGPSKLLKVTMPGITGILPSPRTAIFAR